MSADSRRSSSSSSATGHSGSQASMNHGVVSGHPNGTAANRSSSISRHGSCIKRRTNPVRRCQSMRNPNSNGLQNGNGVTNGLHSSPSFKSINRRPSNVSSSGGSEYGGRNNSESEFVKYYQYKISKPELNIPFRIVIDDGTHRMINEMNEKGTKCRVLVLGSHNSGKTSLIRLFGRYAQDQDQSDSDSEDEYDKHHDNYRSYVQTENSKNKSRENSINGRIMKDSIINGDINKPLLMIKFKETVSLETFYPISPLSVFHPDAYIIVYAVNSRDSFECAKKVISEIYKWDDFESKSAILVANKTDLVRSRVITKQEGRQLAITNNCKYIETSCAISHNVDFLLAGLGTQITLKNNSKQSSNNHQRSKSAKKPNIIKRFLSKTILNKSKSCDNLHVL
ncbi:uncharacterized protein LOC141852877 [Brevipalpus obovatus]|uniref:uncharacterized protein LOC141852877 n=1 Tax=Brevipalpus obovatus TaxID=246614 RepID=UPI003D9EDB08